MILLIYIYLKLAVTEFRISDQIGHSVVYLGLICCIGSILLIVNSYMSLIASKEKTKKSVPVD